MKICENPNCTNPITSKDKRAKYCSRSCAATVNNKARNSSKPCKNCGKQVSAKHNIFCSHTCQHDYTYKEYIARWLEGKESGIKGTYGISNHIRKYMLSKADYKCSSCGWDKVNPITKNVPLEIDHIDGNFANNNISNLRVLCPNCHSLTPTYKNLNKGNGRSDRQ